MALVPRTYSSQFLLQGPVEAWILGGPLPPSSLSPTADANTIRINTNGVPETAIQFIGALEGPANITITESCNEIRMDQHESPIAVGFTTTEAEISFTMKETTMHHLYLAFTEIQHATVATETNGTLGGQQIEVLQAGGQKTPEIAQWIFCLVARINTIGGLGPPFIYVLPYKAMLKTPIAGEFSRSKETMWKVTMQCFADLSRVPGDELMQIVKTTGVTV